MFRDEDGEPMHYLMNVTNAPSPCDDAKLRQILGLPSPVLAIIAPTPNDLTRWGSFQFVQPLETGGRAVTHD
jgi:hypothetical protein